ncbi:type II toxin-antitoxin system RelE/ParE family toxin [Geotalea uraniireducens]|uniref:Plasmid stabilization system n=1 Tax=Geotalea uraniireducens (strain Rf4) TaxID=351605 RepID=A5GAD8_GEOUR|nr:type II toxin-antitoxin system RelE/ParE family toxin [Geotalea uraniireducens]ABQ25467.1 plasmid stabilization system [Geotalea uraniireducens Rf4]
MTAKFQVEITPIAEADIEDIWTFIAEDSPEAATAFILELESQLTTLESFPERCPLVPENEILSTRFRHLIYGNYRTIFRIAGRTVYVLRVIHGSRLLELFE